MLIQSIYKAHNTIYAVPNRLLKINEPIKIGHYSPVPLEVIHDNSLDLFHVTKNYLLFHKYNKISLKDISIQEVQALKKAIDYIDIFNVLLKEYSDLDKVIISNSFETEPLLFQNLIHSYGFRPGIMEFLYEDSDIT